MYVLETFQNKIKSEDEDYYFHRTSYSRKLVARGVVFFQKQRGKTEVVDFNCDGDILSFVRMGKFILIEM